MKLIVIGSQTRAAGGQDILFRAGINSKRKKLTETGEGCMYALAVDDNDASRAVRVLEGAGIRIKSIIQK